MLAWESVRGAALEIEPPAWATWVALDEFDEFDMLDAVDAPADGSAA
ncbi:MAG: hypothetical protein V4793_29875 [Paraburkholderia tropica]